MIKKCRPEFGGLLWRHLTPQRKPQVHNYNPSRHVHESPKDVLENLHCGAHKLVHSERPNLALLYI